VLCRNIYSYFVSGRVFTGPLKEHEYIVRLCYY
jgi:hypothetical protein